MKQLRQDTRWTLISRLPVMLLSLISMTLLTRWLGPEGNGVYTFIFANVNLLMLLFGLQSENAVMHYMAKNEADIASVAGLGMITVGLSALVCALVLMATGLLIPEFKFFLAPAGQPFGYFIWFIVLSFLFRKSQNAFQVMQRATLHFKS